MSAPEPGASQEGERVPLFGTWRNAYVGVVVVLVIEVALFYAFSRTFL